MPTCAATRKASVSARRTSTSSSGSSRNPGPRAEVGEITRTDVAQSQSRLAGAQALLQSAIAQLGVSRANYANVVGQNPADLQPEPSLAFLMPNNPDDAFTVAEQNSPVLRAQQFGEQASRARIAEARAERMPSLSRCAGNMASPVSRSPSIRASTRVKSPARRCFRCRCSPAG